MVSLRNVGIGHDRRETETCSCIRCNSYLTDSKFRVLPHRQYCRQVSNPLTIFMMIFKLAILKSSPLN